VFCQLLQDVEFSQPLHAMENESEKNNNQIVLFKTVTHTMCKHFHPYQVIDSDDDVSLISPVWRTINTFYAH
jgi:hypothetical protein